MNKDHGQCPQCDGPTVERQAVRELPDEADGHHLVTGPEALDAHNQACAWADDPSGDTIADQAAYHRWVEADRLAGDTPRSATWVGDAA